MAIPSGGGGSTSSGGTTGGGSSGGAAGGNTGNGLGRFQPNTKKLNERVDALEQRLDALVIPPDMSGSVKRLQMKADAAAKQNTAASLATLQAQVKALQKRVDSLESSLRADEAAAASEILPAAAIEETIVSSEAITAFTAITITGKQADSGNVAHFGKVIGIALSNVASGFAVQVVSEGTVSNPDWTWTAGDEIYVSGTGLANTPPGSGFAQQMGMAKSATEIYVSIREPVLL